MDDPGGCDLHQMALIAQRSLNQHLIFHQHVIPTALAEITPSLVTQCAPVPTFRVLAAFDDVATHVLLDSVFLGFRTCKMNLTRSSSTMDPAHLPTPLLSLSESLFDVPNLMVNAPANFNVNVNLIADILGRYVSHHSSLVDITHSVLCSIPWLQHWVQHELPLPYIRHFCRHLQRYAAMYSPMAGYDICETTRYDYTVNSSRPKAPGISHATLVATRAWVSGEEILLCGGPLVPLSSDEEDALREQGRNFSVLFLQRSGDQNLFLGPGRFVNHDCQPNLAFVVRNTGEVHFRVIKSIAVGQELSVSYGNDYFGLNNTECMCETCELAHRGWFENRGRGTHGSHTASCQRPAHDLNLTNDRNSGSQVTNGFTSKGNCHDLSSNVRETTSADSRMCTQSLSAPYLDWFDGSISDGSNDTAGTAIHALLDFQRRHYLAISGFDAQLLGDPLTVPCALCQCRTYAYRVAPQGHVHCHKCLRNVMLFSVPWPNRVVPKNLQPLPVLSVESHQQFSSASDILTSDNAILPPNAPLLPSANYLHEKRRTRASNNTVYVPGGVRRPEFPGGYLLAEVEQRLLNLNISPRSFSPSHLPSIHPDGSRSSTLSDPCPIVPIITLPDMHSIPCVMPPLNWSLHTPEYPPIETMAPLSPPHPDPESSQESSINFSIPTAPAEQISKWRNVQSKLDALRVIPAKLANVKWQFSDEDPLLVKNYNQRNLVLCADKGKWYPAVTVPVSDWEDQKLDAFSPDCFHVLFLHRSTLSYGCVHHLDMLLVTDILRAGRSVLALENDTDSFPQDPLPANNNGVKIPMVMRAGRDVEVILKSVQSAAVERLLTPPPRAVWRKWHVEYKLTIAQSDCSPFQYHPFANIDIRPLNSSLKPASRNLKSVSKSATPSDTAIPPTEPKKPTTPSPPSPSDAASKNSIDSSEHSNMMSSAPATVPLNVIRDDLTIHEGRQYPAFSDPLRPMEETADVPNLFDETTLASNHLQKTVAASNLLGETIVQPNADLLTALNEVANSPSCPMISPNNGEPFFPRMESTTKESEVPDLAMLQIIEGQQLPETFVYSVAPEFVKSPNPFTDEQLILDNKQCDEDMNHEKMWDCDFPQVQDGSHQDNQHLLGLDSALGAFAEPDKDTFIESVPRFDQFLKYSNCKLQLWGQMQCVNDFSSEEEEHRAFCLYISYLEGNEHSETQHVMVTPSTSVFGVEACSSVVADVATKSSAPSPSQKPSPFSISAILNPPPSRVKPRNKEGQPSKKRKIVR